METAQIAAMALQGLLAHGGIDRYDPAAAADWTAKYAKALQELLSKGRVATPAASHGESLGGVKAAGTGAEGRIDAGAARVHLLALAKKGVGVERAADVSGLSRSLLWRVRDGTRRTVTHAQAERILAVSEAARSAHARVDGETTRALLRDLVSRGFSVQELARRTACGRDVLRIKHMLDGTGAVSAIAADSARQFHQDVLDGKEKPDPAPVDATETQAIVSVLRKGMTAQELRGHLGFSVSPNRKTVPVAQALKVRELFDTLRAKYEGAGAHDPDDAPGDEEGSGLLPADWQVKNKSFATLGADDWRLGRWRVSRRPK